MKDFFVFLKNKIIEAVTGRRPYEEEFDEGEKGYQVFTDTKNNVSPEIWGKSYGRPMLWNLRVNIETPILSIHKYNVNIVLI